MSSEEKGLSKTYTIKELLEQREETRKDKVNLRSLQGIVDRKVKEKITHRDKFVMIEEEDIPTFFELSGPMALLLHLMSKINRLDKNAFGNLDKYYKQGYLATIRSQNYIAKEMGESQTSIGRWLKILEEKGFIKNIGTEILKRGGSYQKAIVWALGERIKSKYGEIDEVFYYEQYRGIHKIRQEKKKNK